jgi:hypothetical protein
MNFESCKSTLAFAAVGIGGCTCILHNESITSFCHHQSTCCIGITHGFDSQEYDGIEKGVNIQMSELIEGQTQIILSKYRGNLLHYRFEQTGREKTKPSY